MHTISTRAPTAEEQRLIASASKPDVTSYGCITLFFGVAPAIVLGIAGKWLGSFISPQAATYGQILGWLAAAVVLVSVIIYFAPFESRQRQRAKHDLQSNMVQEIHVKDPRVIEIALISDNEPILAFDIGGETILFLQGQWLRNPDYYGANFPEDDAGDEFINGLPEPHSFPSSEFTITRFPHSGEVVAICVTGRYVEPDSVVDALEPEYEFGGSEVFKGSLEDIGAVLAREHKRRTSA